ncbi:hypothetical protein HanXRQr2_Chr08g0332201 [Helianthus annuus]|uniref:DUF674 domain-containing protein n=2 Tax=Helianthus annuus TaxID=4232 RepID=A0A9K3IE20_HELAN|nr:hypothetical protein HanXRQr2_Chr08g0332201 [Helianthus annuus]KAJ0718703.1 hypothetical protein HanLR1_Chr08g0273511 [Helianthus annuus]
MAPPEMCLKLLVDVKGSRVLFAEVPKEFVDFLFHIFSLPLGTLVELIGSNQMAGCLGKLKGSIEIFNGNYLQPGIKMDDIFHPKTAFNGKTFLLSYDASSGDQSGASKAVYRCAKAAGQCHYCSNSYSSCKSNATLCANSICPGCSGYMNHKMALVTPPNQVAETKLADEIKKRGYVKEVVTYMVMDDLVVNPMSTISGITLINKFGVKDLSQLEEKNVSFGKDEGLKLLEASLKTNKVLTTVFMH